MPKGKGLIGGGKQSASPSVSLKNNVYSMVSGGYAGLSDRVAQDHFHKMVDIIGLKNAQDVAGHIFAQNNNNAIKNLLPAQRIAMLYNSALIKPGVKALLDNIADDNSGPNYQIKDTRTTNPATGIAFNKNEVGNKSMSADSATLATIISHAKSKGVDPYTALAVAMQETRFGKDNENYGSAWSYLPDEGIPKNKLDENANILAKALKEKLADAKRLGIDKKGEDHALQVYNGYGLLKPTMRVGGKLQDAKYYGIPVTESKPLDLRKNPIYGKTIISLRDQVLKKDKNIAALVNNTKPFLK